MLRFVNLAIFTVGFASVIVSAEPVQGRVVATDLEARSFRLLMTESGMDEFPVGQEFDFRVGTGDIGIDYIGRTIRANASFFGQKWNLEQVFPLDGVGAKAAKDVNQQLRQATATMSRRKFIRQGDYIPNFAMIDQRGKFLQIRQLQGRPFMVNFIFTRCTVPTMCPASSQRMSDLQDLAREAGLNQLQFVTITFDPAFDSPGILNQYAKGYSMEAENFYLLTGEQQTVDDLLRQFGILTFEEDGTINHTMATLLVDSNGRVSFRKEGSTWNEAEFFEAAQKL